MLNSFLYSYDKLTYNNVCNCTYSSSLLIFDLLPHWSMHKCGVTLPNNKSAETDKNTLQQTSDKTEKQVNA